MGLKRGKMGTTIVTAYCLLPFRPVELRLGGTIISMATCPAFGVSFFRAAFTILGTGAQAKDLVFGFVQSEEDARALWSSGTPASIKMSCYNKPTNATNFHYFSLVFAGVAYVKYDRASSAALAIENLHEVTLNEGLGPRLKVMLAESPHSR